MDIYMWQIISFRSTSNGTLYHLYWEMPNTTGDAPLPLQP